MYRVPFYEFDCPEGYVAKHTSETVNRLHNRRRGRPSIRFNIVKLDELGESVVIANITASELRDYRIMAEEQGNKIWGLL